MNTVTYARYSSGKQRASSLEDQYRLCLAFANQHGLTISHQYSDAAISGSIRERPGYQALLSDALINKFNIILVEDLSRLGRDQVEREHAIRRFEYLGIRVIGVSDGYDSNSGNITRKIQRGVKGLMDELYLDELAKKTHRGLEGKALLGHSCGGRAYGYSSIPIEDPTRTNSNGQPEIVGATKVIHQQEAHWVIYIFEQYANGISPRAIAAKLNEQAVPSARGGTWGGSSIYGNMKKGTGILNNPIYIGKIVWNRKKWKKDPDTGRRKPTSRPIEEQIITHDDSLRIIPQELWDRVKMRQKARYQPQTLPSSRGRVQKYLFSGMLKCGNCGANFIIIDYYRYGCSTFKNKGKNVCNNLLKVPRQLVEEILLKNIKQQLLSKDFFRTFTHACREELTQKARQTGLQELKDQLKACEQEIENIMVAIRQGIITPATKSALDCSENHKYEIEQKIEEISSTKINIDAVLSNITSKYEALVNTLEQQPLASISQIKTQLIELLGKEIRLVPNGDHLIAELTSDYSGLLAQTSESKFSLVAGAGFEPTTFGL